MTSPFRLSQASLNKLIGVHPDLVAVVKLAITKTSVDFKVGEGVRTKERQQHLYDNKASKTLNSRHITGDAVDLYALHNGKVVWTPWMYYEEIADAMKGAAKELGVPIEWGGDWESFKDGVHFQLPRGYK